MTVDYLLFSSMEAAPIISISYSKSKNNCVCTISLLYVGLPWCGLDGEESACNAGDLGWEDPLKKGKAVHSSIPVWRILWTEESDRLLSMGMQRVICPLRTHSGINYFLTLYTILPSVSIMNWLFHTPACDVLFVCLLMHLFLIRVGQNNSLMFTCIFSIICDLREFKEPFFPHLSYYSSFLPLSFLSFFVLSPRLLHSSCSIAYLCLN